MSDYGKQLQRIIREYRQDGQKWPARTIDIARWALGNHRFDLHVPIIEKLCARDLAQAMREEYIIDSKGRRVRAKHPALLYRDGVQMMIWDDIRTAPRSHMELAFRLRRNHIVGECRQAKTDVDSYNDAHPDESPIQMVMDFTQDIEEAEAIQEINQVYEMIDAKSLLSNFAFTQR